MLLAVLLRGVRRFRPPGRSGGRSRFLSALAGLYETLGTDEARQYDWLDSWWYAGRAVRATTGLPVEPEDPAERSLSGQALEQLQAARTDLLSVLNSGGRILAPDPAARAQAAFDCWVEQQEEGWQTADIDLCRSGFERAMGEGEGGRPERACCPAAGGGRRRSGRRPDPWRKAGTRPALCREHFQQPRRRSGRARRPVANGGLGAVRRCAGGRAAGSGQLHPPVRGEGKDLTETSKKCCST